MALHENKIGNFEFIALEGELVPPRQRLVTDDRPGVTGTEFTLLARKGTPFQLISQVDAEDYDDARELYLQYRDLIEDVPQEVVKAGLSCEVEDNYLCKVMDVTPLDIRTIRGAVGNLISEDAEGFLVCRWDLIAVPIA